MRPDLWTIYRKLAQIAISLTVFGVGAGFLGYSLYLPSIGQYSASTVCFLIGFFLMLPSLATAIVLASSIRTPRPWASST